MPSKAQAIQYLLNKTNINSNTITNIPEYITKLYSSYSKYNNKRGLPIIDEIITSDEQIRNKINAKYCNLPKFIKKTKKQIELMSAVDRLSYQIYEANYNRDQDIKNMIGNKLLEEYEEWAEAKKTAEFLAGIDKSDSIYYSNQYYQSKYSRNNRIYYNLKQNNNLLTYRMCTFERVIKDHIKSIYYY